MDTRTAAAAATFSFFALSMLIALDFRRSWPKFWILAATLCGAFVAPGYILDMGVFVLIDGTAIAWVILMTGVLANFASTAQRNDIADVAFAFAGAFQRMFLLIGMLSVKSAPAQLFELVVNNVVVVLNDFAKMWNGGINVLIGIVTVLFNLISGLLAPFSARGGFVGVHASVFFKGFVDLIFSPLRIILFRVPTLLLISLVIAMFLSPLIPRSPYAWKWKFDIRIIMFYAIYDVASILMFFAYKLWPLSVQICTAAVVDVLALYVLYERARQVQRAKEVSKKKE